MDNTKRLLSKKFILLSVLSLFGGGCAPLPQIKRKDDEVEVPNDQTTSYSVRFLPNAQKQAFEFESNSHTRSLKAKRVFDTAEIGNYAPFLLDLPSEKQIDQLIRNFERIKPTYLGKPDLSIDELYEVMKKVVPIARAYFDLHSLSFNQNPINLENKTNITYKRDGTLIIRPGYRVKFRQKNFCLEERKPEPEIDSLVYLDFASKRIPPEIRDIYDSVKRLNKNKLLMNKYRHLLENLFWSISEAGMPGSKFEKLTESEFKALNEIQPGSSIRLKKYHKKNTEIHQPKVEKPITNNPIINYQEIEDGLFTKTDKIGILTTRITFINTKDHDIPIDISNYVVENPEKIYQAMSIMPVESLDRIDEDKLWLVPERDQTDLLSILKKKLDASIYDIVRFLNNFGLKEISQNPVFIKLAARTLGTPVTRFFVENAPILGSALSLYEAIDGRSWVDGRHLNAFERTAALIGVVPGAKVFTSLYKQRAFTAAQLIFTGAGVGAQTDTLPSELSTYVKTYNNPVDVTPLLDPEERRFRGYIVDELIKLEKSKELSNPDRHVIQYYKTNSVDF